MIRRMGQGGDGGRGNAGPRDGDGPPDVPATANDVIQRVLAGMPLPNIGVSGVAGPFLSYRKGVRSHVSVYHAGRHVDLKDLESLMNDAHGNVIVIAEKGLSLDDRRGVQTLVKNKSNVVLIDIERLAGMRTYNEVLVKGMEVASEDPNKALTFVRQLVEKKIGETRFVTFTHQPGRFVAEGYLENIWMRFIKVREGWSFLGGAKLIKKSA